MPPEVAHSHPFATPRTPLLYRVLSPKSRLKRFILHRNYFLRVGGRMKFTKRNLILVLVFILCSASIFRFLNISMITNSPIHLSLAALPPISHPKPPTTFENSNSLTEKETRFLMEFFSRRVPCNLLVFGHEDQYSSIASLNKGGATVFLEDMMTPIKSTNNTRVYKITYNTLASNAYKLLRYARQKNPECLPKSYYLPKVSKCDLALSNLPQEVYQTMWDVVVVDGPSGGTPESPGRMASIYTAGMLARRSGNATHVIVHDIHRTIEKWFSWEFLCEKNLVSSKGRFWHFRIPGVTNATTFCTT